jgi:hypothetical protein
MSLLGEVIVDSEPAMPCQIEEKNEEFSFFMSPAEVALNRSLTIEDLSGLIWTALR